MILPPPRLTTLPVPPLNAPPRALLDEADAELLARAVLHTRVSYFTDTDRERLTLLVAAVLGYNITGGL